MSSRQNNPVSVRNSVSVDLSLAALHKTASWIRDDLDPLVAREGPIALHPDDILTLHSLLLTLQIRAISIHVLRFSRIFLAVRDICSKATRWPGKLVDEADRLIDNWEASMGPLRSIRTPLYEEGGRLYGICEPHDINRESLIQRWASQNAGYVDNHRAYCHGSLGFKAGTWWINGLFAFRDGIIDSKSTEGGISFTRDGAYALVLRGDEEANAPKPSKFTYRCRPGDGGRFRLTAGHYRARYPVRILRDHRLASLWAPRAGIRYDGLFKIMGWTVRPVDPEKNDGHAVRFDVHFESDDSTVDWDKLSQAPTAEEIDDYKMYKIIHREHRDYERRGARDIFESSPLVSVEIESKVSVPNRSMSICEVAGLCDFDSQHSNHDHKRLDFPTESDSGSSNAAPENTSLVDGSSDRGHRRLALIRSWQLNYPSDLFTPLSEGIHRTFSTSNLFGAPTGFFAVEPFSSLRATTMSDRRSYDGSEDEPPDYTPIIDTRFRPVNWNPGPRLNLAPAFNLSDEAIAEIAPFSDLRRRLHSIDGTISPKTSFAKFRGRSRRSRSLGCGTVGDIIFEYATDGASMP